MKCKVCGIAQARLDKDIKVCDECWKNLDCCGLEKL